MLTLLRVLAVIVILPTLAMLWINGQREGYGALYYLLPDLALCAVLLLAAVLGGRDLLLTAYALACGAAIGFVACAIVIALLLRRPGAA